MEIVNNMLYPFRIRVNNKKYENILDRLMKDRTVTIKKDKSITHWAGHELKPIRNDIFIGLDKSDWSSNISLKNPFLKIEKIEKENSKKLKDYIFDIKF